MQSIEHSSLSTAPVCQPVIKESYTFFAVMIELGTLDVGNMRSSHRATAAAVSAELYLDMHHCGLWVNRNVAVTSINYSTFDALLQCVK